MRDQINPSGSCWKKGHGEGVKSGAKEREHALLTVDAVGCGQRRCSTAGWKLKGKHQRLVARSNANYHQGGFLGRFRLWLPWAEPLHCSTKGLRSFDLLAVANLWRKSRTCSVSLSAIASWRNHRISSLWQPSTAQAHVILMI